MAMAALASRCFSIASSISNSPGRRRLCLFSVGDAACVVLSDELQGIINGVGTGVMVNQSGGTVADRIHLTDFDAGLDFFGA